MPCRGALTVVDDHEHASGVAVGLNAHELLDQLVERDDPVLLVAAIEQLGAFGVPRGEVTQSAAAFVFVLDTLATLDVRLGGQRGVLARSGLDRWLLIATHDVVAGMQQLPFPTA